jgi:hypothetical protein
VLWVVEVKAGARAPGRCKILIYGSGMQLWLIMLY